MTQRLKYNSLIVFLLLLPAFFICAQQEASNTGYPIYSTSSVDWTANSFYSTVTLDTEEAKIALPSGKSSAINRINRELPRLIKDQILSLTVDFSHSLGDLVLDETFTLEQLTYLIDNGTKTPSIFAESGVNLTTKHSIDILNISSQLIQHTKTYKHSEPIEIIASRPYTGIIIDARGALPVHGEFIKDNAHPCFFPKIWDTDMNLLYERNMTNSSKAKQQGIVTYHYSDNESNYVARVGKDPLHIIAQKIFGQNRTDPVISHEDALKILTVPENRKLLEDGKVVLLLNKDQLIYDVSVPLKDEAYYIAYSQVLNYPYKDVTDIAPADGPEGILIQIDLKFIADSAQLLPEESQRIQKIANLLKQALSANDFTILIRGHTADVGKPEGQMNLSILRAQAVIHALVEEGVPKEAFSFQGYGGTQPIASNATAEGRAQNRRVDIIARPKATYIQH
ncbi:MAG: OmpA family protein [Treponema sp.]|nr:OmpA family protein [Treponema sp.]